MTPSPPAQAEASETVEQIAERLLPCFNVMRVCDACVEKHTGRQIHSPMCPASYRPAVVVALKSERKRADIAETALVDATRNLLSDAQSERDSRDRRIAELEAENARLREALGWAMDEAVDPDIYPNTHAAIKSVLGGENDDPMRQGEQDFAEQEFHRRLP